MSQIGDTIKLHLYFFGDDGETPIAVNSVTLNFYDNKKVKLQAEVNVNDAYKISDGHYAYDYTIPDGVGPITVEFKGMQGDLPRTHREDIQREWTKSTGGTRYL